MFLNKLIFILAATAAVCPAATILFLNTTTDTQDSAFYSASGVTQIGDQLQLTSTALLASLDTQFFNVGADATFDVVLRFYAAGAPVGSQIGSSFTATNIFIAGGTSETVAFPNLGNLLVPRDVVVTFSVVNVSAGGDIGVNFFDPPTVGTSSGSFFIVYNGTNFAQASTNLDHDNVYLQIEGTSVPEPSTTALLAGALVILASCSTARRARRRFQIGQ